MLDLGSLGLAWAEGLKTAGHGDWRLPDAKELQKGLERVCAEEGVLFSMVQTPVGARCAECAPV